MLVAMHADARCADGVTGEASVTRTGLSLGEMFGKPTCCHLGCLPDPPAPPFPSPASRPLLPTPQLLEATRELVTEANFEIGPSGLSLQAMDSSHVSLVALNLRSDGFEHFRADRSFSMGMNLNNMSKMLRCAGRDDIITMRADDSSDAVTFMFESPCEFWCQGSSFFVGWEVGEGGWIYMGVLGGQGRGQVKPCMRRLFSCGWGDAALPSGLGMELV